MSFWRGGIKRHLLSICLLERWLSLWMMFLSVALACDKQNHWSYLHSLTEMVKRMKILLITYLKISTKTKTFMRKNVGVKMRLMWLEDPTPIIMSIKTYVSISHTKDPIIPIIGMLLVLEGGTRTLILLTSKIRKNRGRH